MVVKIAAWPNDGLPVWLRAIRALAGHPRPVQVRELALLAVAAPVPLSVDETASAFAMAVKQVGTWWD
jgi:hypothetical protein